jgi:hypothetical protein
VAPAAAVDARLPPFVPFTPAASQVPVPDVAPPPFVPFTPALPQPAAATAGPQPPVRVPTVYVSPAPPDASPQAAPVFPPSPAPTPTAPSQPIATWLSLLALLVALGVAAYAWLQNQALEGEVEDLRAQLKKTSEAEKLAGENLAALKKRVGELDERTETVRKPDEGKWLLVGPPGKQTRLELVAAGKDGTAFTLGGGAKKKGVQLYSSAGGTGAVQVYHAKGHELLRLALAADNPEAGALETMGPNGKPLVRLASTKDAGNGQIDVLNKDGNRLLQVNAHRDSGALITYRPDGKRLVALESTEQRNGAIFIYGVEKDLPLIYLGMDTKGNGQLVTFNSEGKDLVRTDGGPNGGRVWVADSRGKWLLLQPGKDVAEAVQAAPGETVAPGDVVSLAGFDSRGILVRRSSSAYDPGVLGVVSGAGGIRPGVVLNTTGAAEERLLSLAGTVYVRADAAAGPIRPGDLLVASGTPGHVMRADPARIRPGSLVGKALAPLARGRGLIPLWVSTR